MRQIIGSVFVSLDGVMQAPSGPDEDRSGGFALGGWMTPFGDEAVMAQVEKLLTPPFDLLLGRRTYELFAAYWPYAPHEVQSIAERFDRAAKYVVTRGYTRLSWQNCHRLKDIDAVAQLKRGEGPPLIIQGSSTLYPQLLGAGLIDRLTLMTFPVVLGSGKRWCGGGTAPGTMRLVEHQVTPHGAVIATYEPAGSVETAGFGVGEPSAAELERRKKIEAGIW